ncbi:MAG: AMP-binding protein [Actinobacteria bacterium]|nr:AMP-binding protein [Actinomycetota bacterium]
MTDWNFANVWEIAAESLPNSPCLIHGTYKQTWDQTNKRANGIAQTLLDAKPKHQDKIAHYLYNCPEYMESIFAIFKAGLVPVNTNYRYGDDEILYLWDNADAVGVIFHATFTDKVQRLRQQLPNITTFMWVDDETEPCPDWAIPYEEAAKARTENTENVVAPKGRSGDDLCILYTGGTTGMPKGVMWRQDDLFGVLNDSAPIRLPNDATPQVIKNAFSTPGPVLLPACPIMHGTGMFTALSALSMAGAVTTLTQRKFSAEELLDTVEKDKVNIMSIVGDSFAKPILEALDANPGHWDLTSLFSIVSSGVMWSESVKQRLLSYNPNMLLLDVFSSSEAIGMGASISSGNTSVSTAKFILGQNARVINEQDQDVKHDGQEAGMVALKGRTPLGYYKDTVKTSTTFKTIDGVRYCIPGDWATVEEDGTIHLLGRGSVCINTGGEKVFPEEVEEIIKLHPAVKDCAAVGIPDDRFGETICAVVELDTDHGAANVVTDQDIITHVKQRLAAYKAPKKVMFVDTIGRSVAGKLDYTMLRENAIQWAKNN